MSRTGQGQKRCFWGATSKDSPSRPSGADLCIFANSRAIWGGSAYPLKTTTREPKLLSWNITWESGPGLAALSPAAHSRKPLSVGSICPEDGGGHRHAHLCDNAGPVQSPSPIPPGAHPSRFLHCCSPSCLDHRPTSRHAPRGAARWAWPEPKQRVGVRFVAGCPAARADWPSPAPALHQLRTPQTACAPQARQLGSGRRPGPADP